MVITKIKQLPKITHKQQSYIEQLAIDLQFDIKRRNAIITVIIERKLDYLDELTMLEAGTVINKFKQWKEEQNART